MRSQTYMHLLPRHQSLPLLPREEFWAPAHFHISACMARQVFHSCLNKLCQNEILLCLIPSNLASESHVRQFWTLLKLNEASWRAASYRLLHNMIFYEVSDLIDNNLVTDLDDDQKVDCISSMFRKDVSPGDILIRYASYSIWSSNKCLSLNPLFVGK